MSRYRSRHYVEMDPFTDLLFNVLLAFSFLFIVTLIFLNPPAKTGIIDPKAEIIITTTWDDNSPDDVDVWVEDPTGKVVWYKNPEAELLHLDRDDRGRSNDTITVDGKEIINPLNQEVVTIRGYVPGEYVVNLHYYESHSNSPVNAVVRVVKVNPVAEIMFYKSIEMEQAGEEVTAVRFTMEKDGSLNNINTLAKKIVKERK
ncbi:MAG: hypothetical protein OQJ97_12810 [Rhodospirillales bacterium]|nr:hypothetical protein [Rhodospirillales bacterium]